MASVYPSDFFHFDLPVIKGKWAYSVAVRALQELFSSYLQAPGR